MANTPMKLADMILPEVFHRYTVQESTVKTKFWQSGVVTDVSDLIADLGGITVHMPFFNDLTGDDEVVDDNADISVGKTTTSMDIAVRQYRARAYGGTDLAADLAGADPMGVIISRFGAWWGRAMQKNLFATVKGVTGALAAEGLNTLDISGATGGAAVFDGESFLDAIHTLGDSEDGLAAIAVHSDVYNLMRKQDLIDFLHVSDQGQPIPTYMGKQVIVQDEGFEAVNGVYTSYIFGKGSVAYAEKAPKNPVEPWRDPLKFGGLDYLIQRRQFVLHVRGIKWAPTAATALATPSNAELAVAGNWHRVYDHKLIKLVSFKHRIAAA
ncbi:coat protein [Methylobacterium ajmalii]|uniref:Coat protein n=1 Tax=Methylobacterium ajmalii TaxID=2738439 RepID=A0ABV0A3X3_9HYPH